MSMKHSKIGIIGVGHVGSHVAASIIGTAVCRELILIDTDQAKATAQAEDLGHMAAICPRRVEVKKGNYSDLADAQLVIISASGPIFKEDRLEELDTSLDTMDEIIPLLAGCGFGGVVMVISNPVDLVALYLQKRLGWPPERVFGSGTLLDSMRLRREVARELGVSPATVGGFVLGEHGESQLAAWSTVTVGGAPLSTIAPDFPREEVAGRVRSAGWDIVLGKGSTEFGIGAAAARISGVILADEEEILPVSVLLEEEYGAPGINAGVPCRLGATGIREVIVLPLTPQENAAFAASCKAMAAVIEAKRERFR